VRVRVRVCVCVCECVCVCACVWHVCVWASITFSASACLSVRQEPVYIRIPVFVPYPCHRVACTYVCVYTCICVHTCKRYRLATIFHHASLVYACTAHQAFEVPTQKRITSICFSLPFPSLPSPPLTSISLFSPT